MPSRAAGTGAGAIAAAVVVVVYPFRQELVFVCACGRRGAAAWSLQAARKSRKWTVVSWRGCETSCWKGRMVSGLLSACSRSLFPAFFDTIAQWSR
uniref:Uncharacterized protein n=1 Tax=Hyaloperonospora arabidopsidis (strain Emoy2) TaxID=559515 RepID=M4BT45_HYAAE